MSKLTETKRAYDAIADLLDKEILKKGSNSNDLKRFHDALDVAFYLLGWAQFEHLVRLEAKEKVEGNARSRTVDGRAWQFLQQNIKLLTVRKQLDLIFHGNETARQTLHDDYDLRNEAAHNYANLPREARDISEWIASLEGLVDKF